MARSDRSQHSEADCDLSATVAAALRMLARRSYTEAELRARLERRRGADSQSVGAALARLTELGLIDDAAWAERFVIDRFERAGRGRHRIVSELATRGIEAELAASVVARVIDPERERESARALMARLMGGPAAAGALPQTGERGRASAYRRLVARGFPAAMIRGLIRDLLADS